ncbi:MAG TPA: FG-GAP-like repeat-containing protein [Pyrinomonadaceae bacterium]|jgi:uncharacterized delta-60 repeat protein
MNSTGKLSFIAQIAVLLLFSAFSVLAASGDVDPTFNASTENYQYQGVNRVNTVVAQPDGKILIGGNFTVVQGIARHGLARLNADGSVDTSFDPPDLFDNSANPTLGGTVRTISLQSNGKILVGGKFGVLGSAYVSLIRLNSNGSLDTSFNNFFVNPNQNNLPEVTRINVRPNDSIVASGTLTGSGSSNVIKLDANGNSIPGFQYQTSGGQVRDSVVQPDEKILISDVSVERHNPDGAIDATFPNVPSGGQFGSFIDRLVVQSDGKILIGGNFSSINGFSAGSLARLNNDGSVDLTFNTNNIGANGTIFDVAIAPDGKIFIVGSFTQFNGVNRPSLAKLNADGTLDTSFAPGNSGLIYRDVDIMSNGQILVAREVVSATNTLDPVFRFNADGSGDSSFVVKVGRQSRVRKIVQQADGKILVSGEFPLANGVARNSLARFNADGTLDTGFVPYFNSLINQTIYAVAPQPDGKVIVGAGQGIVLKRLNSDGSQDTTFVTNLHASSIVYDIQVLPNNQILVGGLITFNNDQQIGGRKVVRLNANGSTDTTFNPPAMDAEVYKVLQQPDGKILIGGNFTQLGTTIRGRIARLNTDGSLDTSFNPPGGANNSVYDFDLQADGKVVIGGIFTALNGSNNHVRIGRLNSDGSLDTGFVQTVDANINAVKVEPSGKILIGGAFSQVGGFARSRITRLNSNGSLDLTFSASATLTVLDISLQADNKILVGGEFTEISNVSKVTVARLLNITAPLRTLFDFDGDGRADISVFRPSTNRWYEFLSGNSTVSEQTFGIANDTVAPADYDGDGKTDIAIYRASSGDWWYLSSTDGIQKSVHWGAAGDIPRPADFDGDGKADYVVFRPSNNVWYRFGSTGTTSNIVFGLAGDKPVTGDFDGDGKSDLAIFRPSNGNWWYLSSVDNSQKAVQWGISTDIPAPADFDGDGKTDFAVYRPSTGVWYIINSSNGSFTIFQFGTAEDKPVPADYDGDGRADIAVFRPSTGTWYQQKTTAGFTAQQFGVGSDVPAENAFVP